MESVGDTETTRPSDTRKRPKGAGAATPESTRDLQSTSLSSKRSSEQNGVGKLLKTYRKSQGLTLEQLADRCGVNVGNLSRIERGERDVPKRSAERIVQSLGILEDHSRRSEIIRAFFRAYMAHVFPHIYVDGFRGPANLNCKPSVTLAEAAVEIGRISETEGIRNIRVETLKGSTFELRIGEP